MKSQETHSFLVEVTFSGPVSEGNLKGTQDNLVDAIRRQLENVGISPDSTEESVDRIRVSCMSQKAKDIPSAVMH